MLMNYLSALAVLLGFLGLWVGIQTLSRRIAASHPESGPFREAGAGCGGGCGVCGQSCSSSDTSTRAR